MRSPVQFVALVAAVVVVGASFSADVAPVDARSKAEGCRASVHVCKKRLRYRVSKPPARSNRTPKRRVGQFGTGSYPNGRIADVALGYVGRISPFGECKQSVNDWVRIASNGGQRLGGGYYADYRREGGIELTRDQVTKGDIIQLNNPQALASSSYYSGMHTAIVVGHTPGSDTFDVVDANFGLPYRIVRRHAWDPFAQARRFGRVVKFWRMGDVGAPPDQADGGTARVAFQSPGAGATVAGNLTLSAVATGVAAVEFQAYYATDPANVQTVSWRVLGRDSNVSDGASLSVDTRSIPDQGNTGWGTVNVVAIGVDSKGNRTDARDYRRITVANGAGSHPGAVDRQAIVSYDQMRPGAPHHGYFNNAWQPFVAQSNTLTTAGATVGTVALPAGLATGYNLALRVCANQPDAGGNCSVVAQSQAAIVNYGASVADFGDVPVVPGSTYWLEWFQPPAVGGSTWVTYWWAGGPAIGSSDQMQAVVRGYNR